MLNSTQGNFTFCFQDKVLFPEFSFGSNESRNPQATTTVELLTSVLQREHRLRVVESRIEGRNVVN